MTPERPKVPSLREEAERFAHRRGHDCCGMAPCSCGLDDLHDAIDRDEELHKEIVAVLRHFHRELGFVVDGRFSERFEEHAAEFCRETGMLAPGKDDPLSDESRDALRRDAYEKWVKRKNAEMFERLSALLAKLEGKELK